MFILRFISRLIYGSEAIENFEKKQRRPKPQRRPQQRVKRRRT